MSFGNIVFTREYLQDLPEKCRRDAIRQAMATLQTQVVNAATEGKTCCIVDISHFIRLRNSNLSGIHPKPYIPTIEDLVEGLDETFPDSKVEYVEKWEDIRPGVREQKKGILVDWS